MTPKTSIAAYNNILGSFLTSRLLKSGLSILTLALSSTAAEVSVGPIEWKADWVFAPREKLPLESTPATYLRKEFRVARPVASARLSATALGWHRLSLNGRRVGDGEFLPGWTDYDKRLPYHVYDVTSLLQPGTNAVGVILGDGWYCGAMNWSWKSNWKHYGEYPELLFQMEIKYADGTEETIVSDGSWLASTDGPIRQSDIFNGEIYDARREMQGWDRPGFVTANWSSVASRRNTDPRILEPARHAPVRAIEELTPREIWQVQPGRWVFDLGQNITGWARLRVPGDAGRSLIVRFAEMLRSDRTLYTVSYRSARSTDAYVCKGGVEWESWEPTFTFHGFRYVELVGLDPAWKPDSKWVTGVVLHSDMKPTGTFTCSNKDLNQLQSNIVWSQKGNFLEVPTDCPQRDERQGWTGDAQVFAPTACFNFNTLDFYRKWLTDLRDAQNGEGAFPHVAPNIFGLSAYDSPAWADAGVIVPWEVYVRFGAPAVLEENFDAMVRWVNYQERNSPHLIRASRGFGDWLQPYQPPERDRRGDTDLSLIGTAYFARSTDLTARAARVLGRNNEALRLESLARDIRAAFAEKYWMADNRLSSDTQTAYLLALAFDLLPAPDRPAALASLLRLIDAADGHLRTGFVGTPLLAPVLTRFGRTDLAYTILSKETYPGWLYSIRQGATTMWERWDSYSHEKGYGDAMMNSFNHYAYGAIGQWLYETVAGLTPDDTAAGYRHFFVKPEPGADLTWAEARLNTPHGLAVSAWHLQDGVLTMDITVPASTTATIIFPYGSPDTIQTEGGPLVDRATMRDGKTTLKVGAGVHRFSVRR